MLQLKFIKYILMYYLFVCNTLKPSYCVIRYVWMWFEQVCLTVLVIQTKKKKKKKRAHHCYQILIEHG